MAKNDKDRLIGRSKSQTLLRRSGLFRKTGGYSAAPAVIQCLYPLDDDGTVTTSLGLIYGGPSIKDGQTMGYTTGGGALAALISSGALSSARFSRGVVPIGYEATAITKDAGSQIPSLSILITSAAGAVINNGLVFMLTEGTLAQVEVAPDGTVSSKTNGVPSAVQWVTPAGQTTVGETDKFCPYLLVGDGGTTGKYTEIQLRTSSSTALGVFSAGCVDLCGTPY